MKGLAGFEFDHTSFLLNRFLAFRYPTVHKVVFWFPKVDVNLHSIYHVSIWDKQLLYQRHKNYSPKSHHPKEIHYTLHHHLLGKHITQKHYHRTQESEQALKLAAESQRWDPSESPPPSPSDPSPLLVCPHARHGQPRDAAPGFLHS